MKRLSRFHSNAVWPAPILIGLFIICYGLVAGCFFLIELGVPGRTLAISDMPQVIWFRTAFLGISAGIFAVFRLVQFHPACNRAYAAWLRLSPWIPDKPLPAGPVHLVWQDAVILGVLTLIGIWDHINPLLPVTVFAFVYLAGFTVLLAVTRQWGPCLILGFLWPTFILPEAREIPAEAVCVMIAIACVVWYGHRESLKAFPWEFSKSRKFIRGPVMQTDIRGLGVWSAAESNFDIGWPIFALSPKMRQILVPKRANIALGALAGWWSFCIIRGSDFDSDGLQTLILFFTLFGVLIRLAIYSAGVAAPFNILGRIVTGRIIVPGYDKIFVAPLAVVIAGIIGVIVVKRFGLWYPTTGSIAITVIWWILFGGGPTIRNWALTGQHRLRPPRIVSSSSNRQMARPV
jgi:hypothetical protein